MTHQQLLETGDGEPLTEDELAMQAVELPNREALSIVAPSGVAGPQALAPLDLRAADAETVPDPGMNT